MTESIARNVVLEGGPCDGMSLTVTWGETLSMEDRAEPGKAARYRPSRRNGVYTFRGFERVIGRLEAS